MKHIILRMVSVCLVLGMFTGCGGSGQDPASSGQPDAGGNPPGNGDHTGNGNHSLPNFMMIRTKTGDVNVPIEKVTDIEVDVLRLLPDIGSTLDRKFTDAAAGRVAAQLGLSVQGSVKLDDYWPSGAIELVLRNPKDSHRMVKTFNVYGPVARDGSYAYGNIVQDADFPKLTYAASVTLDRKWLAAQSSSR